MLKVTVLLLTVVAACYCYPAPYLSGLPYAGYPFNYWPEFWSRALYYPAPLYGARLIFYGEFPGKLLAFVQSVLFVCSEISSRNNLCRIHTTMVHISYFHVYREEKSKLVKTSKYIYTFDKLSESKYTTSTYLRGQICTTFKSPVILHQSCSDKRGF